MIVQDSINYLAVLDNDSKQGDNYTINLPTNFLQDQYYDKIYISEIIIPISFYSINQQASFVLKINDDEIEIVLKPSSPTSEQLVQMIQQQIPEQLQQNVLFGFDKDNDDVIEIIDISSQDIIRYLGLPLKEPVQENGAIRYYASKILNLIQHQIIYFYGNFIYGVQGMSQIPFAIVNTSQYPQFSIFQQYYDINMLQYKYNQEKQLKIWVKTIDNEYIIFNNDFPVMIRFNFIRTYQLKELYQELQQIKNTLIKREEKDEEKEKNEALQQLIKYQQEISGFTEY